MTMLTETEAREKWCPHSRPVMPRQEDCGYQTGNRNYVDEGESQVMRASSCIASACMAWRWLDPETVDHFGVAPVDGEGWVASDYRGIDGRTHAKWSRPNPSRRGFCGAFGRPR